MRYVLECFRIIAVSCVLVTLTACSVADQLNQPTTAIGDSLAVLPFDSDSPELAGIAATIYEEALDQLSVVPDFFIVGREELQPYLEMNLDPEEIATRLGVGHVLG